MSDLAATNCGGGCEPFPECNNGCGSIIWILLLLCCCGGLNGGGDCGCEGGNSCLWIIILLCCCGNSFNFGGGCGC